jgi:hypothetical protein
MPPTLVIDLTDVLMPIYWFLVAGLVISGLAIIALSLPEIIPSRRVGPRSRSPLPQLSKGSGRSSGAHPEPARLRSVASPSRS